MGDGRDPIPAVSAIVRRGERFLLVRRGRPPIEGMYAFPGGRAEAQESLEEAALRELFEETGLAGRVPVAYDRFRLPEGGADEGSERFELTAFLVDVDPAAVATAGDDAASVGWYTADEAANMPIPDSVRSCIDRLGRG